MDKNIKKIVISILEAKGISYDEWLDKMHFEVISGNSKLLLDKIEKNPSKKEAIQHIKKNL